MFSVPRDETEVMVSLSQKDVRDQRGLKAVRGEASAAVKKEAPGMGENFTIGFYVMKVCIYSWGCVSESTVIITMDTIGFVSLRAFK